MMYINTVANLEDTDIREAIKEYLVKRGLEVKSAADVVIEVSPHLPLSFSAAVKLENKVLHEDKLRKPYSEPCPVCGGTQYLDAPSTPGSEGTVRCPNAEKSWHGSAFVTTLSTLRLFYRGHTHGFMIGTVSAREHCLLCGLGKYNPVHCG